MNFFLDAKNIPSLSPCGSKMLDSSAGGVEGGMEELPETVTRETLSPKGRREKELILAQKTLRGYLILLIGL